MTIVQLYRPFPHVKGGVSRGLVCVRGRRRRRGARGEPRADVAVRIVRRRARPLVSTAEDSSVDGKGGEQEHREGVREGKGGKASEWEGFIQEIETVAEKQILNLKGPVCKI